MQYAKREMTSVISLFIDFGHSFSAFFNVRHRRTLNGVSSAGPRGIVAACSEGHYKKDRSNGQNYKFFHDINPPSSFMI
jgi:hypothetical protein